MLMLYCSDAEGGREGAGDRWPVVNKVRVVVIIRLLTRVT